MRKIASCLRSPFTFLNRASARPSGYCMELATLEKALLALDPISRIVPTTRTRITASITAYSAISCPESSDQILRMNSDMRSLRSVIYCLQQKVLQFDAPIMPHRAALVNCGNTQSPLPNRARCINAAPGRQFLASQFTPDRLCPLCLSFLPYPYKSARIRGERLQELRTDTLLACPSSTTSASPSK